MPSGGCGAGRENTFFVAAILSESSRWTGLGGKETGSAAGWMARLSTRCSAASDGFGGDGRAPPVSALSMVGTGVWRLRGAPMRHVDLISRVRDAIVILHAVGGLSFPPVAIGDVVQGS